MARGWDSKSVEAQIESANARHGHPTPRPDTEQLAVEKKKDSLLLHRTRVMRDMENCRDERYRKTLADGLSFLEAQLTELGWQLSV
jgi:hypothetical protein